MNELEQSKMYVNNRLDIRSGDLLIWSGDGTIGSTIIQIFTKSSYTHVGIAWVIGGRVFVVEAFPPAVRIYPLSSKANFYHIPMEISWEDGMTDFLLERVGDPYSVLEVIISYFTSPKDDRRWHCAEFANSFYKSVGFLDMGRTPKSIVDSVLRLGKPMTMVLTEHHHAL